MNLSDWLSALTTAGADHPGFATRDLCRAMNISESAARILLRRWAGEGKVSHVGFRTDTGLDGRSIRIPIYHPTPEYAHARTQGEEGHVQEILKQEVGGQENLRQAAARPKRARRRSGRS